MENLVKIGRARSIGVSNFNIAQIDRILAVAEIRPVVNQVECHPNHNQRYLLKALNDRNIAMVAYSPLGGQRGGSNLAINDPRILQLARLHNKTPAQIILRYTVRNFYIFSAAKMEKYKFVLFSFRLPASKWCHRYTKDVK